MLLKKLSSVSRSRHFLMKESYFHYFPLLQLRENVRRAAGHIRAVVIWWAESANVTWRSRRRTRRIFLVQQRWKLKFHVIETVMSASCTGMAKKNVGAVAKMSAQMFLFRSFIHGKNRNIARCTLATWSTLFHLIL